MAVKIKLKRMGKIRSPHYRIIVADARNKRDGRAIEEIGLYHPKEEPSLIKVNSERAQYWLSVGAQPTEPVLNLLKITGDWQKFKGLPGAEGRLKVAEPKADRRAAFDAALADAHGEPSGKATTPKKQTKKAKADDAKAGDSKAEEKADDAKAAKAKADEKKAGKAEADDAKTAGKADDATAGEAAASADAPEAQASADES